MLVMLEFIHELIRFIIWSKYSNIVFLFLAAAKVKIRKINLFYFYLQQIDFIDKISTSGVSY